MVQNTSWHVCGHTYLSGLLQPVFYQLSFSEEVLHYANDKTFWAWALPVAICSKKNCSMEGNCTSTNFNHTFAEDPSHNCGSEN